MNVLHLLWRYMIQRKTLSLLTILSIAITTALIVVLIQTNEGIEQSAKKGYGPFELTLGAKGSTTQLVLNTYYHVGSPIGNIAYSTYEQIVQEEENESAYAVTTGDSYNSYPIVGVDPRYFLTRYGDRRLQAGSLYTETGQVVVGAHVANMLDLKVGDAFLGNHGLVQGEHQSYDVSAEDEHAEDGHDHFEYIITGILPPLETADDRAVFTTLDYAWHVHGITQPENQMITAIMVQPKTLLGAQLIKNKYNNKPDVQAAYTSKAVADVMNVMDKGTELASFISSLCILLAAISLLLSLTSVAAERKKDVGLMRLIGKSRRYVWSVLIGEGLLLTLAGLVVGLLAGHLIMYMFASSILEWTGVQVHALHFAAKEGWLILGTILIGLIASIGPSLKVYRVDPLYLFRS